MIKIIKYGAYIECFEYKISNDRSARNKKSYVLPDVGEYRSGVGSSGDQRQDNKRRASLAFERLILSNLQGSEIPVLLTLTFRNETTLQEARKCFNVFAKRIRSTYSKTFRYIVVPEYGSRNTKRLHLHALCFGIRAIAETERKERNLAKIWGHGFLDAKLTDGNEKIAFYLSKYLTKQKKKDDFRDKNSYICSRNILRPEVITDFASLYLDHILDVDNYTILLDKEVYNNFVGRIHYKKYKLKSHEN